MLALKESGDQKDKERLTEATKKLQEIQSRSEGVKENQ